jgi:hypothetical protein
VRRSIRNVAVSLVIVVLGISACRPAPPFRTLAELEQTINSEAPVGSNESRVVSFLQSRGIEHSHLLNNPDRDSDFQHNAKLDGKRHLIVQYSVAIIRDVDRNLLGLISWSLAMHFYFDANGTLVAYTAERVGTGP